MSSLGILLLLLALPQESAGGDRERDRAHYARVEEELLERDVSDLDASRRAERGRIVAELRRYREAGVFTVNTDFPGRRVPYFVDDAGRHCAVANLLRFTGDGELVAAVAGTNNHAWVADLRGVPEFHAWLDRVGLTFEEAARIQVPGFNPSDLDDGPAPQEEGGDEPPATGGGAPAPPTGRSAPGAGPLSPGSSAPPSAAAPAGSGPRYGGEDWRVWWEYNKLTWLRPNVLRGAASGDGFTVSEDKLAEARREARALLEGQLEHASAEVRAAAVVAYARLTGPAAVPRVRALFTDAAREVRLAAILALGATASEEGVHALLELLLQEQELAPNARPVAVVALGLARERGVGAGVDRMLPDLLRAEADEELALLLHHTLAPSAHFLDHEREDRDAEARALEALRFAADDETLSHLLDELGGDDLQHRRSAAVALGGVDGGLQPLKTAFELEREPLTRGLTLLSIGEHGGKNARRFLRNVLADGPSGARPWCALALGILARQDEDTAARRAVRKGLETEANRDHRGAYLLAAGIGRDPDAYEMLAGALTGKDPALRAYAALGLGLTGDPRGRRALHAALTEESSPTARAAMAQALALHGDDRDAGVLLEELRGAKNPVVQGQIAVALGFHGTHAAAKGLAEELEGSKLSDGSRAAATEALGILLSRRDHLALGEISSRANFTLFPFWMVELLQHPL